MKLITSLLLMVFISVTIYAQDSALVVSPPIDMSQNGWNKLLQLSNGNTMLFHFEANKHILVKIFDKAGKEIASKKSESKYLNMGQLESAQFEGVFNVNNEGVLFVYQDINNIPTLIRIRYNSYDASVISEDKIVESPSFKKKIEAVVLNVEQSEIRYCVFSYTIPRKNIDTAVFINMVQYNKEHKIINEKPISFSIKGFDITRLMSMCINEDGSLLAVFNMSNEKDITLIHQGKYENKLALFYMPKSLSNVYYNTVKLPSHLRLNSVLLSINPFANRINVIVQNAVDKFSVDGYDIDYEQTIFQYAVILPTDLSDAKLVELTNISANKYFRTITKDTTKYFKWAAFDMTTNKNGLTSVFFQDALFTPRKLGNPAISYKGNLCVINYDDDYKEISAVLIPRSNYYVYSEVFPRVFYYKSSNESFHYTNVINTRKHKYIIVNDLNENYTKTIADKLTDVYDYNKTNAICYKVDKKNVITKSYFFGKPVESTYNVIFGSGYDYNESTNTLAVLSKHINDKESTLHIAWRKMED